MAFIFLIRLIIIFLVFGIPLIVGILVYRDASKRVDCSPWLWALIAALVPSFIGLIIYAIIRRDYPLKPEYQKYADSYGKTSYAQNFDEYGNPISVEKAHRGFPTWAKVLLIAGAILVVVSVVAGCSTMISGLFGYHHMTPDTFFYEF